MKKLNRISQMLMITAFALFLLAAILLTYRSRSKGYSFYENRVLAPRPPVSAEAVLDGSWFSGLENYLIDRAAGHNTLTRLNTQADLLLRRPNVNGVVAKPDILLPWNGFESVEESAVEAAAARMTANLSSVSDLVESYGGVFCYVAVPCQYAYHADKYPSYLNSRSEYTRLSRAALRRDLADADVDFLDMGDVFDALGRPDAFSSAVDNHYSIFGAYETYRAIMERFGLAALDADDFDRTEVSTPYLGSRMRKLLGARTSDERLWIMTPKDAVPFTRADNGEPVEPSVYALPADADEWVTYGLYMGGDVGETMIDTNRPELPSILIYGDSFSNAVECLAYASFDKLCSLDFRYYSGDRSLGEWIDAFRPDYVVCIRDYEALLLAEGNGVGAG